MDNQFESAFTRLTEQLESNFKDNRQQEETRKNKLELRKYLLMLLSPHYFVDLYLVGSSVNKLACKDSDADICLVFTDLPEKMDQQTVAMILLTKVKSLLTRDNRFSNIELIQAKVPLLKFRDITHNINVDLNVHNIVGIRNTRLLKAFADCDSRFSRLVLAVKKWAKANDINDAHRKTLSSYSIALMVLHYLQVCSPPVLPALQCVMPGDFSSHDDYTRFVLARIVRCKSHNYQSLGQLFVGFLKYYSDFDYVRCAISIRLGHIVPKSIVRSFKSPKNSPTHWNCLGIEEPFERTNAASAVHDQALFERIIGIFRDSYTTISHSGDFASITPVDQSYRPALVPFTQPLQPLPAQLSAAMWQSTLSTFIYTPNEILAHPKERKV